jgi:hypothetical protein
MLFKKPNSMKYTDLCVFIDQNVPNIVNPGENPELENTIYNYLWLLVKALAIKKCMFNDFQDYDGYAFYAANRLFFALRKNQLNQGKVIKGKLIRPIKSCLNYTKALLYPMKIEYQRETFKEVIEEEFVSKKFDSFAYKEQLKGSARESSGVAIVAIKRLTPSPSTIGASSFDSGPFWQPTTADIATNATIYANHLIFIPIFFVVYVIYNSEYSTPYFC